MVSQRLGGLLYYKLYVAIMALWAVVILLVVLQYRALEHTNRSVDELHSSVTNLRNSLYFDEPYRTRHSRDLALNIQQIYSLRLQLEQDWQQHWPQPDMSQLLYVTDRFIELAQSFIEIELSVSEFVSRWTDLRVKYALQPDLQRRYWQIGAYVLQALYSEGQKRPQLYRTFDELLDYSYQLPEQEKNDLQQTLASVSSLLGKYAEGSNQVDKLLEHQVHDEVALVNIQLQQDFKGLLIVTIASSAVAFLSMWLLIWRNKSVKTSQTLTTPAGVSAQDKNTDVSREEERAVRADTASPAERLEPVSPALSEAQPLSSEVDIDAMLNSLDYDYASVYLLLEVFIEDHQQDDERLLQLVHSDREAACRKVHSLKGVASSLGARGLKQIAMDLEQTIRQGGTPATAELQNLSEQLQQTLASARSLLAQKNVG